MEKIGVLTGGGDCPGLNAVIRAVVKASWRYGYRVVGFLDGYKGLVEDRWRDLDPAAVSGLLPRGGTILGTTNRDDPFHFHTPAGIRDASDQALATIARHNLTALVVIGGDGSLHIGQELYAKGAPVIGVPKTIDNDLNATDVTFGFTTALSTAVDAIDKLHTTAESHHRLMLLEVMGRYAGWIALMAGVGGGADVILLPEVPFDLDKVCAALKARYDAGKQFSIVVVAEGARPIGGEYTVQDPHPGGVLPRLGGVSYKVAQVLEQRLGWETRVTVLGHLQRGGTPTAYDRVLATRFGVFAVDMARQGLVGHMAALRGTKLVAVPLAEAVRQMRTVDLAGDLVNTARALGICLGD